MHVLAFTKKIKLKKEVKLKEFNLKLLHGILLCNRNLEQWKLRRDDKCDVCSVSQTIEHLLHECMHVKPLWRLIEKYLTLKVLVVTIDAQWKGMGDVGLVRYEPALLPPCPTIRVLSYSN